MKLSESFRDATPDNVLYIDLTGVKVKVKVKGKFVLVIFQTEHHAMKA
jgi:hypothetical protein